MSSINTHETPAWLQLEGLAQNFTPTLTELFSSDSERAGRYSLSVDQLFLDYSKNLVNEDVMSTLFALAEQTQVQAKMAAMFAGDKINTTEDRAVLHTNLRKTDCSDEVAQEKAKMAEFVAQIRSGDWKGSTGKAITDIINIGIGGSDLGPKMVAEALREFGKDDLSVHFISNVDGAEILSLLKTLDPETTLVIVASKTFTTQETMINTQSVLNWFESELKLSNAQSSSHFIGLTSQPENAINFGIDESRVLRFWDWVGGRYSVWSTIGFSVACYVGYENFEAFLAGAEIMDEHFKSAPLEQNMPVLMALLGVWYSNFMGAQSLAVIPYCERLCYFSSYLQQMDMESNGKRVTQSGATVDYDTGPIIWGQTGTNGQHAFFQLLHQGTRLVPIDFIAAVKDGLSNDQHHTVLLGNMLAQGAALMTGKDDSNPHKVYPGNKPSNTLLLDELSPKTLGMLIALYEHKVFVQGAIWDVNPYDQWGVELGKAMAKALLSDEETPFDASTEALFAHIQSRK